MSVPSGCMSWLKNHCCCFDQPSPKDVEMPWVAEHKDRVLPEEHQSSDQQPKAPPPTPVISPTTESVEESRFLQDSSTVGDSDQSQMESVSLATVTTPAQSPETREAPEEGWVKV